MITEAVRRSAAKSLAPALFALCLLLPGGQALAVQGFGITPPSQEITVTPGSSTTGQLTVLNDGDDSVNYRIYATNYGVTGEQYQGVFTNAGKGPDISPLSWFTLPKGTLTVKAGQHSTFNYSISTPKEATVGGHYASVFVETIPPSNSQSAQIQRITRVGSLFYLTVSGALVQHGSLLPLQVPLLQSTSPITADLRLSNSGNVHFMVTASASLSTPFGKVGNPLDFRGEVLPDTTRRFSISLPVKSPIGLYKVTVNVNYLGRNVVQSHWMLLVPVITFAIVSGTILLLLVLGLWMIVRKARRR
ncbi:MAG TPA: hypothetical protein VMS08_01300 [Candidatus Saccharimonadia bacterium]|nr:hypothetical protein [Candidatus Saccharimonadia bacterium]